MIRCAWIAILLAAACGGRNPSEDVQVAQGRALFQELGCAACHATATAPPAPMAGPPLAGVYTTPVQLADGRVVVADEHYLRESITEPDAKIVAGYQRGVMTAGLGASRERLRDPTVIDALLAYIASLE